MYQIFTDTNHQFSTQGHKSYWQFPKLEPYNKSEWDLILGVNDPPIVSNDVIHLLIFDTIIAILISCHATTFEKKVVNRSCWSK